VQFYRFEITKKRAAFGDPLIRSGGLTGFELATPWMGSSLWY
jgi:hypothetical protein